MRKLRYAPLCLVLIASIPSLPNASPGSGATLKNSVGVKLMRIHNGEFEMGSLETPSEEPMHPVRISQDFYLAVYPVTVAQIKKFVKATGYQTEAERDGKGCLGFDDNSRWFLQAAKYTWKNPGFEQRDDHPVVCVSWNDAQALCAWLSKKEGRRYRLPTESEFEYAARAGTHTRFPTGDADEGLRAIANLADEALLTRMDRKIISTNAAPKGYRAGIADWNDGYPFTSPVGKFEPNPWGLYDMNGNVWVWCSDWSVKYPSGPQVDPAGPATGDQRAARGGAWWVGPWRCRSNARMRRNPDESFCYIGIRLAMSVS